MTVILPDAFVDLGRRLDYSEANMRRLANYFFGKHPLSFATKKFQEAFGSMLSALADNWMQLVVEAVEERLDVVGFSFGDQEENDQDSWRLWQLNNMDAGSNLAHTEALIFGKSFVSVWVAPDGSPKISVESPRQTIVARDPGAPRTRLAALKRWVEVDGFAYAVLYEPTQITKYQTARPVVNADVLGVGGLSPWQPDAQGGPGAVVLATTADWQVRDVIPNPLGVVPVVGLYNKPTLLGDGVSEIENLLGLQDAANKIVADMLVASEVSAYRQRWATGLDVPVDPETNAPVEPFASAVTRLWVGESDTTKFGQFDATDLSNYVTALDAIVSHLAAMSRTPPHYLRPGADRMSGESIKSSESGLVSKVKRKQRYFGESWEEVVRLAFAVIGDPRAAAASAETVWSDPEIRTEAEHTDSVLKRAALGVPRRQLWADLGYSPQQIDRFIAEGADPGPAPPPPLPPPDAGGNAP